jgi:hypothetical protein
MMARDIIQHGRRFGGFVVGAHRSKIKKAFAVGNEHAML